MRALRVKQAFEGACADWVMLDYDARFRRRIAMRGEGGTEFLLDLPRATGLAEGDALELEDGRHVGVRAAPEKLMEATCADPLHLARAAWHVGNRHLPCEIHAGRLVLRADHVIAGMLRGQGCEVTEIVAPFSPEGGAYGTGRVQGHSHGGSDGPPQEHGHGHGHRHHDHHHHAHAHDHAHDHDHDHAHDHE